MTSTSTKIPSRRSICLPRVFSFRWGGSRASIRTLILQKTRGRTKLLERDKLIDTSYLSTKLRLSLSLETTSPTQNHSHDVICSCSIFHPFSCTLLVTLTSKTLLSLFLKLTPAAVERLHNCTISLACSVV